MGITTPGGTSSPGIRPEKYASQSLLGQGGDYYLSDPPKPEDFAEEVVVSQSLLGQGGDYYKMEGTMKRCEDNKSQSLLGQGGDYYGLPRAPHRRGAPRHVAIPSRSGWGLLRARWAAPATCSGW